MTRWKSGGLAAEFLSPSPRLSPTFPPLLLSLALWAQRGLSRVPSPTSAIRSGLLHWGPNLLHCLPFVWLWPRDLPALCLRLPGMGTDPPSHGASVYSTVRGLRGRSPW